MTSINTIGGFIELEGHPGYFRHDDTILLSSGRNCFEYLLRATGIQHVYLPKYTCEAMVEPLKKLGIAYTRYTITSQLELATLPKLKTGDVLVYTNYFGVKADYTRRLSEHYGHQLIVDATQAWYDEPTTHTFYSPRKFFGVSDGGCLVTNRKLTDILPVDVSYKRMAHRLKRVELGFKAAYPDYKADEAALEHQPIKQMSLLTRQLLSGTNMEAARDQRRKNFSYLDMHLGVTNELQFSAEPPAGPLYYPYLVKRPGLRDKLMADEIFIVTYWNSILEHTASSEVEYQLAQNLLPLPIDQRYNLTDMQRIVGAIEAI